MAIILGNITSSALEVVRSASSNTPAHMNNFPGFGILMPLISAITALVAQGVALASAIVGSPPKPAMPPPGKDTANPWTMWAMTGSDGVPVGDDPPLQGGGGKLPTALAFDAAGNYLGSTYDEHAYAHTGSWNSIPIWPLNKELVQNPAFLLLSWPTTMDPSCVIEIGVSKGNNKDIRDHGAFHAWTAKTCASATWYHSGSTENWGDDLPSPPCFWVGGHGIGSAQIHLPSHSLGNNLDAIPKVNATPEIEHDYFCNSPARLTFWEDTPEKSDMRERLNTDLNAHGKITLEETLAKGDGTFHRGDPDPVKNAKRAIVADVLSVAHRNKPGFLAEELCSHGTSWGPDWVNEHEGKFCDMATRTLYDVCTEDLRDDCFDMGLKDVVKNGVVKRAIPYSSERHYG